MIVKGSFVKLILSFSLISVVAGASYSKVFVESKTSPHRYHNYGAPYGYTSITGPQYAQINTLPSPVSAYVAPCVAPCTLPGPSITAVNPIEPPANILKYNSPYATIPVMLAPASEESTGYEYSYVVIDENTGDHKAQRELSDGSVVRGEYSFIQPDGYVREVQYVADDVKGFNAVVKNFLPATIEGKRRVQMKEQKSPCPEITKESLKEIQHSHENSHAPEHSHEVEHGDTPEHGREPEQGHEHGEEPEHGHESGHSNENEQEPEHGHEPDHESEHSQEHGQEPEHGQDPENGHEPGNSLEHGLEPKPEPELDHESGHTQEHGQEPENGPEHGQESGQSHEHGQQPEIDNEDSHELNPSKEHSHELSSEHGQTPEPANENKQENAQEPEHGDKLEHNLQPENDNSHENIKPSNEQTKEKMENSTESKKKPEEPFIGSHEKNTETQEKKSKEVSHEEVSNECEENSREDLNEESKEDLKEKPHKKSKKGSGGSHEKHKKSKKESMEKSLELESEENSHEPKPVYGKHKEVLGLIPELGEDGPYHDVIRCIEAALKRSHGMPAGFRTAPSALTYIVLKKLC